MKCFKPNAGFVWNPLLKLPRNMACPCKSGKKWKVCCLPVTKHVIPRDAFDEYQKTHDEAMTGAKAW